MKNTGNQCLARIYFNKTISDYFKKSVTAFLNGLYSG